MSCRCNHLPAIVIPSNAIYGRAEAPSNTRSRDIPLTEFSIEARLPEIMTSDRGFVILPFSIRKLFFATPEKSPEAPGSPPEKRPTRIPLSIPAIIDARLSFPSLTI